MFVVFSVAQAFVLGVVANQRILPSVEYAVGADYNGFLFVCFLSWQSLLLFAITLIIVLLLLSHSS